MRIIGILATGVMTLTLFTGINWVPSASGEGSPAGEIALCLTPMGGTWLSTSSCSDIPAKWTDGQGVVDPQ
jgi:hypothetical protein